MVHTDIIDTYGMLYNWYAVDKSSGLCPQGWHVPTATEFSALSTTYTRNQLIESGSSGFNAVLAGFRVHHNGTYAYLGSLTYFWTSTTPSSNATYRFISSSTFGSGSANKSYGFSVRCLKD